MFVDSDIIRSNFATKKKLLYQNITSSNIKLVTVSQFTDQLKAHKFIFLL